MRKFIVVGLVSVIGLAAGNARAQKSGGDYVVTSAGDTLRGQLQLAGRKAPKVRLYQRGTNYTEFSAAQISSYGSASRPIAISKVVGRSGQHQLLVPLVAGYASLYTGKNTQQDKTYYIQISDSAHVTEIGRSSSQLQLARVLTGCPALEFGSDKTQQLYPYTTEGMTRLVMAYNNCRRPNQPGTIVKRAGGWHTAFGLKAGITHSDFDINAQSYGGLGQHQESRGYLAGVTFNVARLGHLSAQIEANYLSLRSTYGPYEAYYSNIGRPSNTHTMTIQYSQVQIPILLRYEIGYGRLRPYLNAGPAVGVNLNNTSVDTAPAQSSGTVTEPVELGKTSLGLAAGGGVALYTSALPTLSLEVRYDRFFESPGTNPYLYHVARRNTLRLEVGVAF